ncbi:RDD family protein [Myxococcus sp. K38C18041901]|uniref:RDD family protein n=1 Tax=Myxococcus guangdongensis TaxID=2906760 RepID=UPI0020A79458|nr:RDD family protein [Myxococcus guangdongensis]MCP3058464.1 RDD family protein [Myxococcus guangdongensis]
MATRLIPEESPLSKCMKCGALLPPVGECPACAKAAAQTTLPGLPSFLDRDLMIDRRSGVRDDGPAFAERSPAPPSVAPLAGPLPPPAAPRAAAPQNPPGVARPTPPGMTPAHRPAPRAPTPPPAQPSWAQGGGFPVDVPPVPATAHTPMSAMTPAYGTAPVPPRVQPLVAPAPGLPGLPRVESPAPAASLADTEPGSPMPSGLPWSTPEPVAPAPVSSGLPVMAALETPAPSASGLPVMESAPAPVPSALPAMASPAPRTEKPKPVRNAAVQPGVAEVHARPASLWRRLLSFSVDTAAIGGVAALYITLASSVTGMKPEAGLSGLDGFVAWLRALHTVLLPGFFLVLVLALVYCAVAAFLWNGRTLGRLLLGLRLVDTHGLAPAPGRAIVRAMLASLSFVLFLGGFWMALFDRRGQTLHDKLTSTFVVQPS